MGDNIRTLVDKNAPWGAETIFVPKGTIGLVCEVYKGDEAILVETPDTMPFALVLYEKGEYEKVVLTKD